MGTDGETKAPEAELPALVGAVTRVIVRVLLSPTQAPVPHL